MTRCLKLIFSPKQIVFCFTYLHDETLETDGVEGVALAVEELEVVVEDEAGLHMGRHGDAHGGGAGRVGSHHGLGVPVWEVEAVAEKERAHKRQLLEIGQTDGVLEQLPLGLQRVELVDELARVGEEIVVVVLVTQRVRLAARRLLGVDEVTRAPIALHEAPRARNVHRVPRVAEAVVLEANARLVTGRLGVALDHDAVQTRVRAQSLEQHVVTLGAVLDAAQQTHRRVAAHVVVERHRVQVLHGNPPAKSQQQF